MRAALVGLFCAALALIAVEAVLLGTSSTVKIPPPCSARALFPGHGVDAATQRIVLDGLGRASCRLGTTREALVLSFAGSSGDRLKPPNAKVERAVRTGLEQAVDDAAKRGEIPQLVATILRLTIEHAPIDKLISGQLL